MRVTRQTLFVFPHAGGSASFYVPFARTFTSGVKCVGIQYPGKKGTHDVSALGSISDLADAAVKKLPAIGPDDSVSFFGHSMGALVAFEVARRLDEQGSSIDNLFVSACAAPGHSGYDYIPDTDQGLLDAASEMMGTNPEFLQNKEFAERILPTLRGFKAITKYQVDDDATVSCPIYAYYADDDEAATTEKVTPWKTRTTSEFAMRQFPGHHFYLTDHLAELVSDIDQRIADARS